MRFIIIAGILVVVFSVIAIAVLASGGSKDKDSPLSGSSKLEHAKKQLKHFQDLRKKCEKNKKDSFLRMYNCSRNLGYTNNQLKDQVNHWKNQVVKFGG